MEISDGATFEMSGGTITSNTGTDLIISNNSTFRLSGNATIDILTMNATSTVRTAITINGSYSGTVSRLNLNGGVNSWVNQPVIINGTPNIINMFNNALSFSLTTHVINSSGFLVLK